MDPLVLWTFGLLLLGLVLLIAEFFIPSAGVIAVSATLSLSAALVLAFICDMRLGLFVMIAEGVAVPAVLYAAVRYWPDTFIGRLILIQLPESDEDILPESHFAVKELVGSYGRAKTKMLPGGSIEINGQVYDAISEGMPIEAGESIKVVAARTRQLIVRPVPPPQLDGTQSAGGTPSADGTPSQSAPPGPDNGPATADLENMDFDSL